MLFCAVGKKRKMKEVTPRATYVGRGEIAEAYRIFFLFPTKSYLSGTNWNVLKLRTCCL